MKKSLFCLVMLCLGGGSIMAQSFSVENGAGKRIYYEVVNGGGLTAKVVASGGEGYDGVMDIPTSVAYNGQSYTVVEIGKEAFNGSGVTSVTMGSGVTTIGVSAFRDCWALASIELPNSVTEIERYAFMDCGSLTSITLPKGVTSIGKEAFAKVVRLSTVYWNAENVTRYSGYGDDYHPFKKSPVRKVVFGDGVRSIPSKAFNNFGGLDSVIIGSGVGSIGDKAFASCSGLEYLKVGAMTPPTITGSVFEGVSSTIDVFVPCDALGAYRNDAQWRYFTNIQCSDVGIEAVRNVVKVYPNPTMGMICIEGVDVERVEVWSVAGMKVAEYGGVRKLDLSALGDGLYLVKIVSEEGVCVHRVVKR